jgi:hypothetical protein
MRVIVSVFLSVVLASGVCAAQTNPERCKPEERRGGEIAEAIAGFQQAGAASAASTQNFFFDFYISRPLPLPGNVDYPCLKDDDNSRFGPATRWWGNVRVASYPQQINTPAAQFVTDFGKQIGNVPVNKLAQSAEFVVGIERRMTSFKLGLAGNDALGRQRFVLGWFAGGGATGPLEPLQTLQVFATPSPASPQYPRFIATYPAAANSQYVGFISPDRDRFYRQFSGGVRLTTFYEDVLGHPYLAAPAIVSISFGQNEQITGGRMEGVVGRFEAFYPLVLWGDRSSRAGIVYLFGSALLRIGSSNTSDPFVLQPSDVPGYDPRVAIVTSPTNRDMYLIGAGIDIGQLIKHP